MAERINELRLLVHPLFLLDGDTVLPQHRSRGQKLFNNACARFVPMRPDETLAIMPNLHLQQSLISQARRARTFEQSHSDSPTWLDLCESLKRISPVPNRIFLVRNFVFEGNADALIEALERRKLAIDSHTQITIGAEFVESCGEAAIRRILALPMVNKVRLDTRVATFAGYERTYTPDTFGQHYDIYRDSGFIIWAKQPIMV